MYRTNNFSWKLTHVLCILGHLGLIAGAAIAYVYNASRDRRTLGWADMAGFNMARMNPCHHARLLVARNWQYATPEGRNWQYATPDSLDAAALHMLPGSAMALVSCSLLSRTHPCPFASSQLLRANPRRYDQSSAAG